MTEHNRCVNESYGEAFNPDDPHNATVKAGWSTGNRTHDIDVGDRVLLLMVGDGGRGIVRSGHVVSDVYMSQYYNSPDPEHPTECPYVDIEWDLAVPEDHPLPTELLQVRFPQKKWRYVQRGGEQLDQEIAAEIERLWINHVRRHYASALV